MSDRPEQPELTIPEIEKAFLSCASHGGMRSANAALRIARDQLAYRSGFEGLDLMLWAPAIVLIPVMFFSYSKRPTLFWESGAAIVLTVVGGQYYRWRMRFMNARFKEERAEIITLFVTALDSITSNPSFAAKPLDVVETKFLLQIQKERKSAAEVFSRLLGDKG